jgi:aldehyde dehydrogenase (NAD+)
LLESLNQAVLKRAKDLTQACIEEYGAPVKVAEARTNLTANSFIYARDLILNFNFTEQIGSARVVSEPIGVVGIITPWNASSSQICMKLSSALGAGCTAVIKPSELSALQTEVLMEALFSASLPNGVINLINGRGDPVGNEISLNKDIDLISFTGSTKTGKLIYKNASDTVKRITLELGGKSPNLILEDADYKKAIPQAVFDGFGNNGQMCIAGTRLLVPRARLTEVLDIVKDVIGSLKVGYPWEEDTQIGPLVTQTQFDRVQRYLQIGLKEADLLIGGPGKPEGLEKGFFVKPTAFYNVENHMTIAQEEIFGPVLSILTYRDLDEAIEKANDTDYGLAAYISSSNLETAYEVARKLKAGRVTINGPHNELIAPFGGFKQSGLGREYGIYGLRECLEPKTILGFQP